MIKHFWQVSLKFKRPLLLSLCIPVSSVVVGSVIPFLIGKMLASLSNPSLKPMHYLPYLIGFGIVGAISNRLGYVNQLVLQARSMAYLQSEALDTLLKRSSSFHNNRVSGKLVSDAVDYPAAYNQLNNALFVSIVPFVVVVISGIILVSFSSWILGLLLLAMATFAIGSGIAGTRGRTPLRIGRHKASKHVVSHLADTIVNNQTVKTFANEAAEMTTHHNLNNKLLALRVRDWQAAAKDNNVRVAMLIAFQICFVLVSIFLTRKNPSLLGVGIFSFSYTITLTNKLMEVNTTIRSIEDGFLQGMPLTEIMAQNPEILDAPDAKPLTVTKGSINLKDVVFKYEEASANKQVFESLNLSIRPSEKVGLVGPSGGGKSTLTRLLLRFEDIQAGEIDIDGQDIKSVTQQSLRRGISYVPQEPLLFHRSIKENIAYSKPNVAIKKVVEAAKLAHADDFIRSLPNGYDTIVGERGVKLSGGQRQRVAIARAILKDAPILVLDEATSALDSESEVLIQKALWELMKDRTAIVVAHRLSTIQKMDRIVVLDNGKIIEEGSHKALLKNKGLYAKLWQHQSGGFIEE
jgi:ATP-binding cassette subfamily B protein